MAYYLPYLLRMGAYTFGPTQHNGSIVSGHYAELQVSNETHHDITHLHSVIGDREGLACNKPGDEAVSH